MWQEQQLEGPTPHGGALVIMLSNVEHGTSVITEYDARGLLIYRFEYQRLRPEQLVDGTVATLTVTDWDEQIVENHEVAIFPPRSLRRDQLAELLAVRQS